MMDSKKKVVLGLFVALLLASGAWAQDNVHDPQEVVRPSWPPEWSPALQSVVEGVASRANSIEEAARLCRATNYDVHAVSTAIFKQTHSSEYDEVRKRAGGEETAEVYEALGRVLRLPKFSDMALENLETYGKRCSVVFSQAGDQNSELTASGIIYHALEARVLRSADYHNEVVDKYNALVHKYNTLLDSYLLARKEVLWVSSVLSAQQAESSWRQTLADRLWRLSESLRSQPPPPTQRSLTCDSWADTWGRTTHVRTRCH